MATATVSTKKSEVRYTLTLELSQAELYALAAWAGGSTNRSDAECVHNSSRPDASVALASEVGLALYLAAEHACKKHGDHP